MDTVTVLELRNNGAAVLDRVVRGEALVVTRDGAEVAGIDGLEVRTVPPPGPLSSAARASPGG